MARAWSGKNSKGLEVLRSSVLRSAYLECWWCWEFIRDETGGMNGRKNMQDMRSHVKYMVFLLRAIKTIDHRYMQIFVL